VKTDYIMKHR